MALNIDAFTDFARPQQAAFDGANLGLANLGRGIQTAQDRQSLSELGKLAGAGQFETAAQQAFAAGKSELGLGLLQLGQDAKGRAASDAVINGIGGMGGGLAPAPSGAGGMGGAAAQSGAPGALAAAAAAGAPGAVSGPGRLKLRMDAVRAAAQQAAGEPLSVSVPRGSYTDEPIVANNEAETQAAEVATGMVPAAPVQVAQAQTGTQTDASPADLPAGQPVQSGGTFRIPSGDGTAPEFVATETPAMKEMRTKAELYQRAATLDPKRASVFMQTASSLLTEYRAQQSQQQQTAMAYRRDELQGAREDKREAARAAREEAKTPSSAAEFAYARRNGMTKADSPAAYEKEKADLLAKSEKLTENQTNAGIYAARMESAEKILTDPNKLAAQQGRWNNVVDKALPMGVSQSLASNDFNTARQAELNFLSAVLRKESGASISPGEYATAERIYFPRPTDNAEQLANKAASRADAIRQIKVAAGGAYKGQPQQGQPAQPAAPTAASSAPPASKYKAGDRASNGKGQDLEFDGSKWVPVGPQT